MKLKAVIDTNIAISGLLWKGSPNEILKLARDGKIHLCCTEAMIEELRQVIEYERFQKRIEKMEITKDEVLNYYLDIVTLYSTESKVEVVKTDPSDDKFIGAAIDSRAYIVISGDKHLLDINAYEKIQVLDPSSFLKAYNEIINKKK